MIESKDLKDKICEYLAKIDLSELKMDEILLYSEIAKNVHSIEELYTWQKFAANFGYKFAEGEKKDG